MKPKNYISIIFCIICSTYLTASCANIEAGTLLDEILNPTDSSPTEEIAPVTEFYVDDFGADPYDDQPDSNAIQAALAALSSGQTLLFTSGIDSEGYQGYLINKTIFIVMGEPKTDLILTSTDPDNPALLAATGVLKGFVMQLFSRTHFGAPGELDNITVQYLHIDAGRDIRECAGEDQIANGIDDNWGSWVLNECTVFDDPWCSAGGISIPGATDFRDIEQDYLSAPSRWSTGFKLDNLSISNVECGTALGFSGAESSITNNTIDTAGEHTHVQGCATTDPDGELAFWSDGITYDGTGILVENNTVINASDVGIVFFGGKDSRIINNTVISEDGNYGAFAGIAVHPWGFGDISGLEVIGNTVISTSDTDCGGIHAGINIGTHMWNSGCRDGAWGNVGNPNTCSGNPEPPQGTLCLLDQLCQLWAYVAPGGSLTLMNNSVTGAHINFLIEGIDNMGELVISGNESFEPQETDWTAAKYGCFDLTWGPLDFVAHHPSLPGWTDLVIHCEY